MSQIAYACCCRTVLIIFRSHDSRQLLKLMKVRIPILVLKQSRDTLLCFFKNPVFRKRVFFMPTNYDIEKSVTTIPFHTCSQIIMFKNMPLYYTRQNLVGCVRVCIFTSAKNCISTYFVFNYRHDEIKLTLSLCWRTVSKRL